MTLPEFGERIAALPASGFLTDESKFDRKFIYSLIHTASAQAKRMEFAKSKKTHPSWYFPYFVDFDKAEQIDDCYYRFDIPQYITFDSRISGMGYVGSIKQNNSFRLVQGRAKFASMQSDSIMRADGRKIYVLLENDYIEVYATIRPRNFKLEACWFDPTQLSNYNIEKDNYPIEASLVPEVEKIILQTNLIIITKSAMDTLQDKKDSSSPANISR